MINKNINVDYNEKYKWECKYKLELVNKIYKKT